MRASPWPASSASRRAEIYFTAGATESNNIALRLAGRSDHLITSAIEHQSVLAAAHESGAELTILRPRSERLHLSPTP